MSEYGGGAGSVPLVGAPIAKVASGIRGLDAILEGGLPAGRTTLLSGGPGTGKTVLAMEFLCRGARDGSSGLFVSFEERAGDLRSNAAAMGIDIAGMEDAGKLKCIHAEVPHESVKAGEFNIQGLLSILDGHTRAMKADRIVLDAIDVLMRLFDDPELEREELYILHDWLRDHGITAVLTVKTSPEGAQAYPFLDFMADCVLVLDQRMAGQVRTRRLNVLKYRGSSFLSNEHPYVISPRGIVLIPLESMSLEQMVSDERVSSGSGALDATLGGGYQRSSSILLAGASGTGKTTLASSFAREACRQNHKVLYVSYEEPQRSLIRGMTSVGIDLEPEIKKDMLRIMASLPESAGSETHLLAVLDGIRAFAPDHLVVDAISACERMGSETAAFDFLVRLLSTCRREGITCLFTNQIAGPEAVSRVSGTGIASLVDTMIVLQYADADHVMQRRLLVVKSRGSRHSMSHHGFRITNGGIVLEQTGKEPGVPSEGKLGYE